MASPEPEPGPLPFPRPWAIRPVLSSGSARRPPRLHLLRRRWLGRHPHIMLEALRPLEIAHDFEIFPRPNSRTSRRTMMRILRNSHPSLPFSCAADRRRMAYVADAAFELPFPKQSEEGVKATYFEKSVLTAGAGRLQAISQDSFACSPAILGSRSSGVT